MSEYEYGGGRTNLEGSLVVLLLWISSLSVLDGVAVARFLQCMSPLHESVFCR